MGGTIPQFGSVGILVNLTLIALLIVAHWFDRNDGLLERLASWPLTVS